MTVSSVENLSVWDLKEYRSSHAPLVLSGEAIFVLSFSNTHVLRFLNIIIMHT